MSLGKIVPYDPHSKSQPRGVRVRQDEWIKHRCTLEKLWILENRTLPDVKKIMASQLSFLASKPQYTRQFEKWEWRKNTPRKLMESAIRRTGRQPGTHDSTDPRGRTISQEHCARFRRRHPSFESISSPTPAVTSPSAADSCRVPVADSSLSVSEQMSDVVDHGKSPDSRAEDRDLNNGTSQSPVNGIEPMTPPNEADAMEIDDGGPSDSKLLAPIRLLPHMDRVESVRDRPTPVLWDDRAFFNDGELLQCPPYQETLLRASPWYGK